MYTCKNCWNKKEFKENYHDTVTVYISDDWDFCHSESDPQLIEVVCVKCNHSTEDGGILVNWEKFVIC